MSMKPVAPVTKLAQERGPSRALSARDIAVRVIERVERDEAFAATVLDGELTSAIKIVASERALATELVYGVLRSKEALTKELSKFVSKPLRTANPTVRAALFIGAYQLLVLDRIPSFAAVSESVTIVREKLGPKPAAFVNAVLRKVSASGVRLDRAAIAKSSVPDWIVLKIRASLGDDEAAVDGLIGGGEAPDLSLVVYRAEDRQAQIERLAEAVPEGEFLAGHLSPHAITARFRGDVRTLPGFSEGKIAVQEEGSQVIALAASPPKGARILDACAGRGNKSLLLAARDATARVHAVDRYPAKLEELSRVAKHIGLGNIETFAIDWTIGNGGLEADYDVVLVDAPCSGTGTIRRRPELAGRKSRQALREVIELQKAIVLQASSLLRKGGRLVYSVCSILEEECEGVVRAFPDSLGPLPFSDQPFAQISGGKNSLRLLPHLHGTDGYFMAQFERI